MPIANPVLGETELPTTNRTYLLCYSWPAQKAVSARFGKRFRDVLAEVEELDDAELEFMFTAALQHHQPELTPDQVDSLISEVGLLRVMELVVDCALGAYGQTRESAAAALREAAAGAPADPPEPETRGKPSKP